MPDACHRSCLRLLAFLLAIPWSSWAEELTTPAVPQAQPLTLGECYALALKQSERIATRQELLAETEGRFLQALSGVLPRASFSSSDKRQDGSGGSAFTLRDVPERKFVFTQPLFSGFKEFAAMAAARAERRERQHEKTRAEHLLFVDVADAFHLLLEQREDLDAVETMRTALIERIDELKERERLGRSRASEVTSATVQLRHIEAEVERVRSQESTARQLLEFLTGLLHIDAVTDSESTLAPLAREEDYLIKSGARPDVRAAEEAQEVANKQVTIARSKFWPAVDVETNYYTERAGAAQGVDWDVLLTLDVPIFQGGQTVGAVKEASSRARQAKLRSQQTQREATLDIRNTYTKLQAAMARTAALEKALEAAEENYRLQVEDYRRNLVNNLEVLQALQALEDSRRDVIHATHEVKRLYWRLRAAIGEPL
jgi:outer membrane protein